LTVHFSYCLSLFANRCKKEPKKSLADSTRSVPEISLPAMETELPLKENGLSPMVNVLSAMEIVFPVMVKTLPAKEKAFSTLEKVLPVMKNVLSVLAKTLPALVKTFPVTETVVSLFAMVDISVSKSYFWKKTKLFLKEMDRFGSKTAQFLLFFVFLQTFFKIFI